MAPVVEQLEQRALRSVSVADGTLTVAGTPGNDQIVVTLSADSASLLVKVNGEVSELP